MKYEGRAGNAQDASTFVDQMEEAAKSNPDPVVAMMMRVASEMMAVFPKHAATLGQVKTLMLAMPEILISVAETVAGTAYQSDPIKTREATLVLLRRALASYEKNSLSAKRIYVRRN